MNSERSLVTASLASSALPHYGTGGGNDPAGGGTSRSLDWTTRVAMSAMLDDGIALHSSFAVE